MVVLASGSDWYGRTVHDVYREKVLGVTAIEETEAMSLGNELEPMVLRRAAEKLGIPRLAKGKTIRHPTQPRHLATPDAFGVNRFGDVLLQAKVVGLHPAREWGDSGSGADGIPESVFVQCAWELYVACRRVNHPAALLGTEIRTYTVDRERDGVDELVGGLIEIGAKFWRDHVETKKPPPVDGSEGAKRMLRAIWPRARRPPLKASPAAEVIAREYFEASAILKEVEARKELAKQQLAELVTDHEGMTGDGWRLFYKWRDPVEIPATTRAGYRHFDCRPLRGK